MTDQVMELEDKILDFGMYSCIIMAIVIYLAVYTSDSEMKRYMNSLQQAMRRRQNLPVLDNLGQ